MKRKNTASSKVRRYATKNPQASVREIATAVGCSYDLAYNVIWKNRKDMEAKIATRINKHVSETETPASEQKPQANDMQVGGEHYKRNHIQPWDYITANNLGYLEGNVVKYITRWPQKGGISDLEKARHYLDKLIELAR